MEKEEYKTSDVYLAAFLQAADEDVSLVSTERQEHDRNRVFFVFEGEMGLIEKLKIGFVNNTAPVRAGVYAQAIKQLKQLCFSDSFGGKKR